MAPILRFLSTLQRDERGMTTVEYVIALCLVGAVAVGMWSTFGGTVRDRLHDANGLIGDEAQHAIEVGAQGTSGAADGSGAGSSKE